MAVNVRNPSAHGLHLVQNEAATRRRFVSKSSIALGFKRSVSPKISRAFIAVQSTISNCRTPVPQDTGNSTLILVEAIEPDSPATTEGNLVKGISIPLHQLRQSEFLENGKLYRQKYVVRSYEVGADNAMPIATIISLFQDVLVGHIHFMGIAARGGFGATEAMHRHGLMWIIAKIDAEVVDFPKLSDVIAIDSWIAPAGRNGVRRDWIVRRSETNEVFVRATSTWYMMSFTRRGQICKMPDSVRAELEPFFSADRFAFQQSDAAISGRITKLDDLTAKYRIPALKSCRADLDLNQHVTNNRFISWLLQSVPDEHMETHNLASISVEYKRECRSGDVFESLTSSKRTLGAAESGCVDCEFTHLLRSQDSVQHDIARARTTWRKKPRGA